MRCELLKPTWLGIKDSSDLPRKQVDIEYEQEQNLIGSIGLTLWGFLTEAERQNEQND